MAKFKTEVERMKHKQAKLIPVSMWFDNELFAEHLDDTVIVLMKTTTTEVLSRLSASLTKLNNQWKKKQAWLGIALTQPNNLSLLEDAAIILKLNPSSVFSLFAILGNKVLLDEYSQEFSPEDVLKMVKENEFYPYRKGAEHGHPGILNFLEILAAKLTKEMIIADDYAAYKNAAKNGHVEVLRDIEARASECVLDMIQAQNFYAFRLAGFNGHVKVLEHLKSKAPQLFDAMVGADHFFAYRKSVENKHPAVSNWLLANNSKCFAYAEAHMREYGEQSVNPFIEQRLAALHREALITPPPQVFDLKDPEQAKICFYMARNLIRRNERALDDELRFLLTIPAVKALAHRAVTPEQPNELIRLALTTGNHDAATILLNLPEVHALTEENNFYKEEIQGKLDLARLSKDRESSMTALTMGEQKRLDGAIQLYGPTLKEIGTDKVMNGLRAQLRTRYEANPAQITNTQGNRIILPMDFADFQKIKLSEDDYQLALKAYYQNKNHSAWRYLAKPNPWMHEEAEHVYLNKRTGAKWSTFEEYQPLIAMLWLAAGDKAVEPTDGHTLQSRLDHFVDELALLGRSHNWDQTRANAKNKSEEYDDLEGDKPSCFSGVKRRLFQSVLGHPLITILTEDKVLEEIRNFARAHFEDAIQNDKKEAIKAAFDDYIVNTTDMTQLNKDLLGSLNIPVQKQLDFERFLSNKYGAQYTEDFTFVKLVRNKFTLSGNKADFFSNCHALMLDGSVAFYQMVSAVDEPVTETKVDELNVVGKRERELTDPQKLAQGPQMRSMFFRRVTEESPTTVHDDNPSKRPPKGPSPKY